MTTDGIPSEDPRGKSRVRERNGKCLSLPRRSFLVQDRTGSVLGSEVTEIEVVYVQEGGLFRI